MVFSHERLMRKGDCCFRRRRQTESSTLREATSCKFPSYKKSSHGWEIIRFFLSSRFSRMEKLFRMVAPSKVSSLKWSISIWTLPWVASPLEKFRVEMQFRLGEIWTLNFQIISLDLTSLELVISFSNKLANSTYLGSENLECENEWKPFKFSSSWTTKVVNEKRGVVRNVMDFTIIHYVEASCILWLRRALKSLVTIFFSVKIKFQVYFKELWTFQRKLKVL